MAKQKSVLAAKQVTKLSSEQVKLFKVAYLSGARDAFEVGRATQQLSDKHTVDSLFQALDTAVDKFESEGLDLLHSHAW
ncbi:hypothetical protein [Comamonas sp.]|uniref:hypothetical protein n=1 Tax=Comamonas sp. TaxID=34028 RepID=UPI00289C64AA|nr:hypothetical protein [Comamonas sp.]